MLLWFDQPAYYTTATASQRWTTITGGTAAIGTSGAIIPRAGTAYLTFVNVTDCFTKTLGSDGAPAPSGAKAVIGCRFRMAGLGSNNGGGYFTPCVMQVTDVSTPHFSLTVNTDGTLAVRTGGANGTIIASTTYALSINTWYYLELEVTIANAGGTIELYVDGVNKLSTTGDTQNTANATWNGVNFGQPSSSGGTADSYITDIYIMDGTDGTLASPAQIQAFDGAVGDVKVELLQAVAGNGANTGFTRSTGSDSGANVDDPAPPDGDSTYNYASASGTKDTYTLADLPSTAVSIFAVQPVYSSSKDDAGGRALKTVLRIGGVDYVSTNAQEVPSVGAYRYLCDIITKSPATNVSFTPTEVNAAEGGVQVV